LEKKRKAAIAAVLLYHQEKSSPSPKPFKPIEPQANTWGMLGRIEIMENRRNWQKRLPIR